MAGNQTTAKTRGFYFGSQTLFHYVDDLAWLCGSGCRGRRRRRKKEESEIVSIHLRFSGNLTKLTATPEMWSRKTRVFCAVFPQFVAVGCPVVCDSVSLLKGLVYIHALFLVKRCSSIHLPLIGDRVTLMMKECVFFFAVAVRFTSLSQLARDAQKLISAKSERIRAVPDRRTVALRSFTPNLFDLQEKDCHRRRRRRDADWIRHWQANALGREAPSPLSIA